MVAFIGVLLALFHRSASGRGQAMEANMVDGVNFLATYSRLASKAPLILSGVRESNALNGGVPCYACYDCKDASRYMSVGAPEPQFFAVLLKGLGLSAEEIVPGKLCREDKKAWPYNERGLFAAFPDEDAEGVGKHLRWNRCLLCARTGDE